MYQLVLAILLFYLSAATGLCVGLASLAASSSVQLLLGEDAYAAAHATTITGFFQCRLTDPDQRVPVLQIRNVCMQSSL